MPTYTNANARSVTLRGGISNRKHATVRKNASATTDFYPTTLPAGVSFVSHKPVVHPFMELATVTSFPSDPILCMGYSTLQFHNQTGGIVSFYANEDDTNVLEIPVGVFFIVEADGKFGEIVILSGGTHESGVTVWGS
jgi:hypothetical protein